MIMTILNVYFTGVQIILCNVTLQFTSLKSIDSILYNYIFLYMNKFILCLLSLPRVRRVMSCPFVDRVFDPAYGK